MGLVKAKSWKSAVMGGSIGGVFFAIAQQLGGSKSALAVHGGAGATMTRHTHTDAHREEMPYLLHRSSRAYACVQ